MADTGDEDKTSSELNGMQRQFSCNCEWFTRVTTLTCPETTVPRDAVGVLVAVWFVFEFFC